MGGERKNFIFSLSSHILGCFLGKIENPPLLSSYDIHLINFTYTYF